MGQDSSFLDQFFEGEEAPPEQNEQKSKGGQSGGDKRSSGKSPSVVVIGGHKVTTTDVDDGQQMLRTGSGAQLSDSVDVHAGGGEGECESTTLDELSCNTTVTYVLHSGDPYELNRDVYNNDMEKLITTWKGNPARLNEALHVFDCQGLSPIHLALRMGREKYLELFVREADPRHFNARTRETAASLPWTVLEEAVVYGNKKILVEVLKGRRKGIKKWSESFEPVVNKFLKKTGDLFIGCRWKLQSWVPLVTRLFLPGDNIVMYKKGNCLRIDSKMVLTSLVTDAKSRGDSSIIFNPDVYGPLCVLVVDKVRREYLVKNLTEDRSEEEWEAKAESLLKLPVTQIVLKSDNITFSAALRRGRLKFEDVENFEAVLYNCSNMKIVKQTRVEHTRSNKSGKSKRGRRRKTSIVMMQSLGIPVPNQNNSSSPCSQSGGSSVDFGRKGSFEKYLAGKCEGGRPVQVVTVEKQLKATMGFSTDPTFHLDEFMSFLHISDDSLRSFVESAMRVVISNGPYPPGAPVTLDLPVVPTTKLVAKSSGFSWQLPEEARQDSFYLVPKGFTNIGNKS